MTQDRGMCQRRVEQLATPTCETARSHSVADTLVTRTVPTVPEATLGPHIYGGLDHVLASGHKVNVLVLDTEVLNTGGQMGQRAARSELRPAVQSTAKKDLGPGLAFVTFGNVPYPRVAGRQRHPDRQERRSTCVCARTAHHRHGPHRPRLLHLRFGMDQQQAAVLSGYWPLFRYTPTAPRG